MPYFFGQREGDRVVIRGADARHLSRSLRARAGEVLSVVDPSGLLLDVKLESVSDAEVAGLVVGERDHRPEPRSRVTVAVATVPAATLETVLARCTELGAHSFLVIQADRSVARGAKPARWTSICREAAMLAGRLVVPAVEGPISLREAIGRFPRAIMLDRDAGSRLAEVEPAPEAALLIGPEGGWTEREVGLAGETASLGPRNLRVETAAAAGLAVFLAAAGDL